MNCTSDEYCAVQLLVPPFMPTCFFSTYPYHYIVVAAVLIYGACLENPQQWPECLQMLCCPASKYGLGVFCCQTVLSSDSIGRCSKLYIYLYQRAFWLH